MALAKPRASYQGYEPYATLARKSAALLYGLAKSQACVEGNKRVALLLVVAFIRLNDADLEAAPGEVAEVILEVAESDGSQHDSVIAEVAAWLSDRIHEE